nr:rab-3-interacting molecule unc-10-like [Aedes albopictus]
MYCGMGEGANISVKLPNNLSPLVAPPRSAPLAPRYTVAIPRIPFANSDDANADDRRSSGEIKFMSGYNKVPWRKQDEVATLVDSIRQKSEQQKKAGVELDATCHICLKTKFADGIGHICNYCNIRCCAKCGGKVTLRNNKVSTCVVVV